MGYGLAPNALSSAEGGMSRYFSQRFAQVTNPPLDSIRESDGMTLRVALGAKPTFSDEYSKQLVIDTPILQRTQLEQIRRQSAVSTITLDMLYTLISMMPNKTKRLWNPPCWLSAKKSKMQPEKIPALSS